MIDGLSANIWPYWPLHPDTNLKAKLQQTVKRFASGWLPWSYEVQKCWFRHDPQVDNNELHNDKNEEVIEKIFKMLETFTLKIIDLENQIKTKY